MNTISNYQNKILNELCEFNIPFTLFTMNGYQLRGTLLGYDENVLVIEVDGRQQMIYMHAISTLAPHRSLEAVM